MSEILYTVALNENGELIKASNAEKNCNYFCPICKLQFTLRKSGNIGKNTKRPHYAHRILTTNCTPETALHFAFKNLLAKKIDEKLLENIALNISWECKSCGNTHTGNLLKKVTKVKLEYSLTGCKPDIALLGKNDKVFAVIEIVVTHKPAKKAIKFYKENSIILLQINLSSDEDIEQIDQRIANPSVVATCFNPTCKKCGRFQESKILTIIDGTCWKCNSDMKAAYISCSNGSYIYGLPHLSPSDFSASEKSFAIEKGVLLDEYFSKRTFRIYIANRCASCKSFIADQFMFRDYISPARSGRFPVQEFNVGYYCKHCDD